MIQKLTSPDQEIINKLNWSINQMDTNLTI